MSRGFRNNNPLNIRYVEKNKWQGLIGEAEGYCRFEDPVMGIRAGAALLVSYQDRHGLNTISKIVNRWAPPADKNNTLNYIKFVCAKTGFSMNEVLDLHSYWIVRPMLEAMIDFENAGDGHPYTEAQINRGLELAGIRPPAKASSRSELGGKIAVGGGIATGVSAAMQQANEIAQPISEALWNFQGIIPLLRALAPYAIWLTIAVVVVGGGYVIYAKWDNRAKGVY